MAVTTQNTAVSGWASVVGLAKESTYGVPASGASLYMPLTQAQMSISNKLITRTPIRRSKSEAPSGYGLVDASGSIDTSVDPDSFGLPLALSLGTDVVSASGAAFSHLIKLGSQSTATVFMDYGKNSVSEYTGIKFGGVDITCKAGADLTAKFALTGQTVTLLGSQSLSPTYTANPFYEWSFIQPMTIDGVTFDATDFTISVKNDNKAMYTSTSGRVARAINELGTAVTGTFTFPYSNDTLNALLWGGNSGPVSGNAATHTIVLSFIHPNFAATGIPYSIKFTLNGCVFSEAPIPISAKSETMQAVKFTASESTAGAADSISVQIISTQATSYV